MRPPKGMTKPARDIWKRTCDRHPHLTQADAPMLREFCRLYAQLDAAIGMLEKTSPLAISKKQTLYISPAMQAVTCLENRVLRWARALGLVPTTRPKSTSQTTKTTPISFKITG